MKTLQERIIEILDTVVNDRGLFNDVRKLLDEEGITENQYEEVMQKIAEK